MQMSEIIRKYRKEKQLTQEEMAQRLGVTAPAVNKWENGNSYPDIGLLTPIARLLGISTDTLLSYEGNLSPEEESQVISRLYEEVRTEDFDKVFQRARGIVRKYPGNEQLIFNITQMLDTYRTIIGVDNPKRYDGEIVSLYERILGSGRQELVHQALIFLFYHYLNAEDYEKAGKYLNQMPKAIHAPLMDQKSLQANLCRKSGKREDAYRLYEELLYSSFTEINQYLTVLCSMAQEDGEEAKVRRLTDLRVAMAKLFSMGKYMEALPEFDVAVLSGDKEKCMGQLSEMIENMEDIAAFVNSDLFCHIKKSVTKDWSNVAFMLKKSIEQDESMGFLKSDARYARMIETLDSYITEK